MQPLNLHIGEGSLDEIVGMPMVLLTGDFQDQILDPASERMICRGSAFYIGVVAKIRSCGFLDVHLTTCQNGVFKQWDTQLHRLFVWDGTCYVNVWYSDIIIEECSIVED